jgi:hypothetical protein
MPGAPQLCQLPSSICSIPSHHPSPVIENPNEGWRSQFCEELGYIYIIPEDDGDKMATTRSKFLQQGWSLPAVEIPDPT